MTVKCVECTHFSLKTAGGMATQGYGHCLLAKKKYEYQSATFSRSCREFEKADHETIKKRKDWLTAQHEKFIQGLKNGSK